jgi:5-carboxymethyl-2-hydroxymuconate isomerase
MPHIIAEYTEELDIDLNKFTIMLHHTLSLQETIKEESIKTRLIPVQASVVGTKDSNNLFIHICLKLLPGRSNEQKSTMAQALYTAAKMFLADDSISLSVETCELHAQSYVK